MADSQSIGYIYIVTNMVNGKEYVGQTTKNPQTRWKQHCADAARPDGGSCRVLNASIRRYGAAAFTLNVLTELPIDRLDEQEAMTIADHRTRVPHGYNLRAGGKQSRLHPETAAKIAAGNRGKERTAESRQRYRQVRLNESPELRQRRTAHAKHYKPTADHVAKMNAARIQNGVWVGLTDDIRRKMGDAGRGKKRPPRVIEAIRRAHLGAKRTPEQCANISAGIRAAASRRRLTSAKEQ